MDVDGGGEDNTEAPLDASGITGLIFGGGGSRGYVAHVAALASLKERRCLDLSRIVNVHGTSIGAVVAFLLCITKSPAHLWKLATPTVFSDLLDDGHMTNLVAQCGWSTARRARAFLEDQLADALGTRSMTFRAFAAATGMNLVVNATDMVTCKGTVFSVASTPDVSVVSAILASCALPFVVAPQKIVLDDSEGLFLDGGIACNYLGCIERLGGATMPSGPATLGIRIVHQSATAPSADAILRSPIYYVTRLAGVILGAHQDRAPNVRTIDINPCATSIFSLTLSQETIRRLKETAEIAVSRAAARITPLPSCLSAAQRSSAAATTTCDVACQTLV